MSRAFTMQTRRKLDEARRAERLAKATTVVVAALFAATMGAACGQRAEASANRLGAATRAAQSATTTASADAGAPRATATARTTPSLDAAAVRQIVFPTSPPSTLASCDRDPDAAMCVLRARWGADATAWPLVQGLYRDLGVACGVTNAFTMDGGYRGLVRFVPEMPQGRWAHHLAWVDRALRNYDTFLRGLERDAGRPIAYRWRALAFHFARSLNGGTPAAWANGWNVSYNVVGGINNTWERVENTLFHELFHSNDADHGWWSTRTIQTTYASIVARCGARTPCLTPYAPNTLRVRNGTYYSFQPGNDVREYAAELAVRYYLEQQGRWRGRPFKCGPPENARVWRLFIDEFFGGVDRTAACGP